MAAEILSINSLRIGYAGGKSAKILLPDITTKAFRGELIAVIGRNGIGKSTLLRTMIGLQSSYGGNVEINGQDISHISRLELARLTGFISTEIIRVSNMKVSDMVSLGRFPHTNWIGRIDSKSNLAVNSAISKTGLNDLSERYVSELSDGERQKAMIARVLAQDTEIMVMDEPTAFLDIKSKYEIINLLLNLTAEGKTIIFSTHDFNIAVNHADKIWLMLDDGLIEGAPEDLMLGGSFDHLFDSDLVGFNSDDGSFSLRNVLFKNISVSGEGLMYFWTEKALKRAGYLALKESMFPVIQTPSGDNNNWNLIKENSTIRFESLYSLIRYLKRCETMIT